MAKAPAVVAASPAAPPRKAGTFLGLALLTLLGIGAGAGLGVHLVGIAQKSALENAAAAPEEPAPPVKYSGQMAQRRLETVITNLALPADSWIRLEASVIFDPAKVPEPEATMARIQQDTLAYLRTLTVAELQGPSALQHLRDDLNERAGLRSDGGVAELVIETLVIQ